MTERLVGAPARDNVPDPESAAPVPIPLDTARGEPAAEEPPPPARRATPLALILTALLPGAGHVLTGAPVRGLSIMLPWAFLLGTAYWSRARVFGIRSGGTTDDYVALATLVLCLAALW